MKQEISLYKHARLALCAHTGNTSPGSAGISYETFQGNTGLRDFFTVTSYSLDRAGASYISSMESPKVVGVCLIPLTDANLTDWHPMKFVQAARSAYSILAS